MENLSSNFWIIPLYLLSNLSFLFNLVCTPCTPLLDKIRKYAAEYKDINRAAEQAVTECIEENILADFLRKNRTEAIEVCIFEYDEKREKELIRKAEYAEGKKDGLKEGQKQGEERVFEIYRLYRDKYTENQIAEQMKIDVDEVRHILEKFKE